MLPGKGISAEAAAGASSALSGAIEELRIKYEKKEEAERKSAAAAAATAASAPPADADEGSDSEWLDDPGVSIARSVNRCHNTIVC